MFQENREVIHMKEEFRGVGVIQTEGDLLRLTFGILSVAETAEEPEGASVFGKLTEAEAALLEELCPEPTSEEVGEMRRTMGPEFFPELNQRILMAIRAEGESKPH